MSANLRIDGERLWQSLMEMAEVGALPNGGCARLALTDADKAGRDLFAKWCHAAGCELTIDDVGNMFVRRPGRNPALAPVATGSHLDTQPHGVMTEAPLEVVNWTNEEGSRFAPAMVASGVFAGQFEKDFALTLQDSEGATFADELARIGYLGDRPCGEHTFAALYEAHIEQGPILEAAGLPIGVVTGAQGQRWYDVKVRGRDSHAGSTPMSGRKDALVATSKMVVLVQALAEANAPHAVGTVGELFVSPNSRNTIPGEVSFSVDVRHPDVQTLASLHIALSQGFESIAAEAGVEVELDQIWDKPPVEFHEDCVASVRNAADALGYDNVDIISGAGHDACQVCAVAPTGMIFVPCEGGISHNESENATPEDLEKGCNVLLHAMLASAGT